MTTTPDPLLIAKTTRLALQFLATDTMRPTVTSAVMELVMEDVSLASPKLRRQLMDEHSAALDWVLRDAYTSQVPTPTFIMDTDPVPEGGTNVPPAPDGRIAYRERVRAVLAAAKDIMPEALAHAFTWGYLAGEADTNPQPESAEFANIANPFGQFTE